MMIDRPDSGLRERLLANEDWESPMRERYESEMQSLLVRKLTPVRYWSLVLVSVFLVGASFLTGWLAATVTTLPTLARMMFVEGTIFQLVAVVYCVRVIRGGVFRARQHPVFLSGLMWCFSVFLAVHFLMLIPETPNVRVSVLFVGITLVTMIGAGVQLLRTCIEQSELNTHERLLETVLRLSHEPNRTDQAE